VIPRNHQAAALPAEAADRGAILLGQAVAGIHREQPELIEVALVQGREYGIRRAERVAIPGGDGERGFAAIVDLVAEKLRETAKTGDRPVVAVVGIVVCRRMRMGAAMGSPILDCRRPDGVAAGRFHPAARSNLARSR
jgi:hypothetical protein